MSARLSRTIGLTLASEAAAVAATTWVTRRFAGLYAEREVDAYFVLRQVLGWVLSVGLFGLNVSLPRALARNVATTGRPRQVLAALALSAPVLAVIALVAAFAPRATARILLYDQSGAALVVAASLLFVANALFGIAAASLQGIDRFGLLAAFRVVAWGIAPVVVTAWAGGRGTLASLLTYWSGAIFAIDVALFALVARGVAGGARVPPVPLGRTARALLRFGGVRMVGAIAQLSMVALAPTLVLWCGGDARAAAAFSVAAMFTMLLAPVRLALQPVALTQLAALGDDPRARRLAVDYTALALCAAAAATAALSMSADRLVGLWLGPRYAAEAAALRLSILVIGAHFVCYTLEGAIDPADERDARPRAQLAAAAVFAALVAIAARAHAGWPGVLVAQLVAVSLQLALYLGILARRYGLPAARELVHGAVTVGAGCALVGVLARRNGAGARATVVLALAEAATALALVALARAAGARWPALVLGSSLRSERRPPCAASAAPSGSTAAPSRPGSSSG